MLTQHFLQSTGDETCLEVTERLADVRQAGARGAFGGSENHLIIRLLEAGHLSHGEVFKYANQLLDVSYSHLLGDRSPGNTEDGRGDLRSEDLPECKKAYGPVELERHGAAESRSVMIEYPGYVERVLSPGFLKTRIDDLKRLLSNAFRQIAVYLTSGCAIWTIHDQSPGLSGDSQHEEEAGLQYPYD